MTYILKERFACASGTLLLESLLFAAASVGLVAVCRLRARPAPALGIFPLAKRYR